MYISLIFLSDSSYIVKKRRSTMEIISWLNEIVWGAPTLIAMLAAGALFSAGTGFFQLRHAGHWLKCTIFSSFSGKQSRDGNSISQFQAMSAALAATLGTGNIAGVSAAVAAGGAGAVFWMWISAVFGMMTGFAENVLGIYYRRRTEKGDWSGGAMCYMESGLAEVSFTKRLAKPLAVVFAVLCMLSAFGMGNLVQVNSAVGALQSGFGVPPIAAGLVLAAAAALIIFGGVRRIGSITAKLVPFMSGFYIIGALWITAVHFQRLPSIFGAVLEGAFGIDALCGGINGYIIKQAVSMGFRRGVFSNEAGLGTSVSAHAAADVAEPCVQGMWSIFEVFFDTIVMCSLTAVILLVTPCSAPSAEHVFQNISLETQYFRLTEEDGIITSGAPMLVMSDGAALRECGTAYAGELLLPIADGDITFSNIMTVTGVQSVSESGEPLFADVQRNIPVIESAVISEVTGAQLSAYAFSQTFGSAAGKLLSVAVVLFAFSTVIGWSCFGSGAAVYIFGSRAELPFKCAFILTVVLGSVQEHSAVWEISDLVNGLMALPNLLALFVLSPQVFRLTDNYRRRVMKHEDIPPLLSADSDIQCELAARSEKSGEKDYTPNC